MSIIANLPVLKRNRICWRVVLWIVTGVFKSPLRSYGIMTNRLSCLPTAISLPVTVSFVTLFEVGGASVHTNNSNSSEPQTNLTTIALLTTGDREELRFVVRDELPSRCASAVNQVKQQQSYTRLELRLKVRN